MSLGQSSNSVATQDQAVHALRVTDSDYGRPLRVVYGRARIPGSYLNVTDYKAVQQKQGGKGSGTGGSFYIYYSTLVIGLCTGVWHVGRAWGNDSSGVKHYDDYFINTNWSIFGGAIGQAPWSYMTAAHPGFDLGYSGITYVAYPNLNLGTAAQPQQLTWEVFGIWSYDYAYGGSYTKDALLSNVVWDAIYDTTHGLGFNVGWYADDPDFDLYCRAAKIFVSVVAEQQQPFATYMQAWGQIANCEWVFKNGQIWPVPLLETPVYNVIDGVGYLWTPNMTPEYYINDDAYEDATGGPLEVVRRSPLERYNVLQVEFTNANDEYTVEIVEAKDDGEIAAFYARQAQVLQLHDIPTVTLARQVAQQQLQIGLAVRNTYKMTLLARYFLIDPGDIIAITDETLGLENYPVRVRRVTLYGPEKKYGVYVEAEDIGVSSTPGFPHQPASRYKGPDPNVQPPAVFTPALFEPPTAALDNDAASQRVEIWLAAIGQNLNQHWGGCNVYLSLDGATFTFIGAIRTPGIYGSTWAGALLAIADTSPTDTSSAVDISVFQPEALTAVSQTEADVGDNLIGITYDYAAATLNMAYCYAYWRLNDQAGNFVDSSGQGHTANAAGYLPRWIPGPFTDWSYGTWFGYEHQGPDGQDFGYAIAPTVPGFINQLLLSAVIFVPEASMGVIVSNGGNVDGYQLAMGSAVSPDTPGNNLYARYDGVTGWINCGINIPYNRWTHVALGIGPNFSYYVYVNGVLVVDGAAPPPIYPTNGLGIAIASDYSRWNNSIIIKDVSLIYGPNSANAQVFQSMCLVDPWELISPRDATLVSTAYPYNTYYIGGHIARGLSGTAPAGNYSYAWPGARALYIGSLKSPHPSILRYKVPDAHIGAFHYFKFASINEQTNQEQPLDQCQTYAYQVNATGARGPNTSGPSPNAGPVYGASQWLPNHNYNAGDVVTFPLTNLSGVPDTSTHSALYWRALNAGTSGPNVPFYGYGISAGSSAGYAIDNNITWMSVGYGVDLEGGMVTGVGVGYTTAAFSFGAGGIYGYGVWAGVVGTPLTIQAPADPIDFNITAFYNFNNYSPRDTFYLAIYWDGNIITYNDITGTVDVSGASSGSFQNVLIYHVEGVTGIPAGVHFFQANMAITNGSGNGTFNFSIFNVRMSVTDHRV